MVSNIHDVLSLAQGQEVALKKIVGPIGSKLKGKQATLYYGIYSADDGRENMVNMMLSRQGVIGNLPIRR
jgi:hypothetical protein